MTIPGTLTSLPTAGPAVPRSLPPPGAPRPFHGELPPERADPSGPETAGRPADWLAMHEASVLLGVSPATLRRWADAGQIAAFTTPGGHRRFERSALLSLLSLRRSHQRAVPLHREAARDGTTQRPASRSTAAGSLGSIPEAARDPLRGHGLRMTNALLAYLDASGPERDASLQVAWHAATAYGWIAGSVGASLREVIELFQDFRAPFVRELAAGASRRDLDAAQTSALLVAATEAMDRLLEASMHGYEAARPRSRRVAGGLLEPAGALLGPAGGSPA